MDSGVFGLLILADWFTTTSYNLCIFTIFYRFCPDSGCWPELHLQVAAIILWKTSKRGKEHDHRDRCVQEARQSPSRAPTCHWPRWGFVFPRATTSTWATSCQFQGLATTIWDPEPLAARPRALQTTSEIQLLETYERSLLAGYEEKRWACLTWFFHAISIAVQSIWIRSVYRTKWSYFFFCVGWSLISLPRKILSREFNFC